VARVVSRHTITGPVAGTSDHFAANLLSGQADIISAEEAAALAPDDESGAGAGAASAALTAETVDQLTERGYLVDPDQEARDVTRAYLDFADARDAEEVQIFFVGSYACNFGCTYCYQDGYGAGGQVATPETVAAFYLYLDGAFADRSYYVTLFGGEPLLPGEAHRRAVSALVDGARERDVDVAVVTNGYHLADYLDELSRARVREIQVTLDGPKDVHDERRPLAGGGGTFDRVVQGVDAALARGIPVNLRVVVDRDNLSRLPELAALAIERGWTENPGFKTQLGRNYELHACQARSERLYGRLELHEELFELCREHPEVLRFHRPAFSFARRLAEDGELPPPLFDACTGTKTEWAFDMRGGIYACTATVGKSGEELGTFYPSVSLDREKVERWQDRDTMSIAKCKSCRLQLACGGGCAAVATHAAGTLDAPDCRPVAELVSLGLGLYRKETT
jgi:uncharacterized protein